MSTDFNLDNEGSGFAFEEDDLDLLLAEAESNEGPEDPNAADTSVLFGEAGSQEAPVAAPKTQEVPEPAVTPNTEPEPAREPEKKPEPAPKASPEPKPSAPRISIPSTADEIENVTVIITVLDAYRKLSREEKKVVSQFINNGDEITKEAEFVITAMSVDPMVSRTMEALKEAKNQEAVDRAFYVMDLDDNLLYSLGSFVAVFTNEEGDRHGSRSVYARELVRGIEKLDPKAMQYVNATEGVLRAVRP